MLALDFRVDGRADRPRLGDVLGLLLGHPGIGRKLAVLPLDQQFLGLAVIADLFDRRRIDLVPDDRHQGHLPSFLLILPMSRSANALSANTTARTTATPASAHSHPFIALPRYPSRAHAPCPLSRSRAPTCASAPCARAT